MEKLKKLEEVINELLVESIMAHDEKNYKKVYIKYKLKDIIAILGIVTSQRGCSKIPINWKHAKESCTWFKQRFVHNRLSYTSSNGSLTWH